MPQTVASITFNGVATCLRILTFDSLVGVMCACTVEYGGDSWEKTRGSIGDYRTGNRGEGHGRE